MAQAAQRKHILILMEQLTLDTIFKHIKDKINIRSSHHGFIQGKTCLTNFNDEITGLLEDEEQRVSLWHSHKILKTV